MNHIGRLAVSTRSVNPLLNFQRVMSVEVSPALNMTMAVKHRYDNITKSVEDKRLYRGIVLDNGMKVLLISDDTTDKSAACIDVAVGYMSDPDDLPGLAHFCEHMLFLGTEKYPDENKYNQFLSQNAGRCNAFTSTDVTNYYFDVAPDHLKETLDIFAQFFIAPLFTESATDKEVNAIESENDNNLLRDVWRLSQLKKSLSKKGHPYSKYGTGNKQTLVEKPKEMGISVREELLKFHSTWYAANMMSLIVLGKESLDDLEAMVIENFSQVKSKDGVEPPSWPESPCGPDELQKKLLAIPVKDLRNLVITFPITDLSDHYKSCPAGYVAHFIGHEGPGSILSALRSRGWCNGLRAGPTQPARGFAEFSVAVDLSEEGVDHVDDIINIIFQYINLLKKTGPKKESFEEMRSLKEMNFRFKDKEPPMSYVTNLASNITRFAMEDILKGHYILDEWRPDLIVEEVLNKLTPNNMRVVVQAQKFKPLADMKEEWYGTDYSLKDIPQETLEKWNSAGYCDDLALPPPNEFIPTDFEVLPVTPDIKPFPTIIQDSPLSRVWYKQDDKFLLPKTSCKIDIGSPLAYLDPNSCNKSTMYVYLLEDALNEYSYAATLAGLHYSLGITTTGLQLVLEGYSSKQHVLLEKIVERMANFQVDPKRFEILKENHMRSLRNFKLEQPHSHAMYFLYMLMFYIQWTKEELMEALEGLTASDVEEFVPHLLSNIHLEFLIHGSATKERALQLSNIVEDTIKKQIKLRPLLPKQMALLRQIQLADRSNFVYRIESSAHPSSCTAVYLQCGTLSTENNMKLELIAQILKEPFFTILRTKEQLGYIVRCSIHRSYTEQGLMALVQSSRDPEYVEKRIEAFFDHMLNFIIEMSEEDFEKHKEAVAVKRLEKPKMLWALSSVYWREIVSQLYHFDRDNVEVDYMRTLTKQDVIQHYQDLISHDACKRHKLSVQVVPAQDSTFELRTSETAAVMDNGKVAEDIHPAPEISTPVVAIEDILSFHRSQALCPYPKPYMIVGARSKL
ncbi:insulin-degrading enzyme [Frankliniella occidentalis]|uniref:Insulin-degrading enzyme n=1 Tax=Frankliniella occidentalis TaxID=133901 RepID=A0A6J1SSA9_FRAOC|nr:insulin-degrading enzyme [Frankliniella occidentalis]